MRELECDTWQGSDDELDALLDKLNKDSISCEKQFIKIKRDNDDIFEVCESITAAARPPVIRPRNQTGANITPTVSHTTFKPQTDLKPTYLNRDCTLPEFIKFSQTFVIYMNSSGSVIPMEAVFSNLRVHMDPFWYTELIGKGLNIKTELQTFPRLMDEVSFDKFPLHNRRMKVFRSQQTGDTLSFLREIIENIRLAEWHTFTEEAAASHIFMAFTKCEESKRACYKMLSELTQGDTKALMERIQAIDAFPDNKSTSVKPINLRDECL